MKSFYYLVNWSDATRLRTELESKEIPFSIDKRGQQLSFVFPDLPIRQYNLVRDIFGGDDWHPID